MIDIQTATIIAPVIIGSIYYLIRLFILFVLRFRENVFYDPRPVRFWFIVSCVNAFFSPIWADPVIPLNVAIILLTFLLYLWQSNNQPDYYNPRGDLNKWA